jgi:hypothetical protein
MFDAAGWLRKSLAVRLVFPCALALLAACRGSKPATTPPAPPAATAQSDLPTTVEAPAPDPWVPDTTGSAAPPNSEDAAEVRALPYLQGYRPAEDLPVVTDYDPDAASPGLNLYVSGHAAEAVLMGMDGQPRHFWRQPLRRLWPDLAKDPEAAKVEYWRRVYLYPNGDLLAIYEGLGLVKLDAQSRVLWARQGGFHHDLEVSDDGRIYVLEREAKLLPRINPRRGVFEEFVTVLDPAGNPLQRISILEALERSPSNSRLQRMRRAGDIFHTNTLEILDGRFASRLPALRKGNILLSIRELDLLAVLDPERQQVVWTMTGPWHRQHQPTFLENGHLLLFDNLGANRQRDRSRVLEVDPVTGKIVWQYGHQKKRFFSKTLGSCQGLPNGDILITDSHGGRAIEVTRDRRVVWQFNNPHRAGDHGELVAALFDLVRLPQDFPYRGDGNPGTEEGRRAAP